MSDSPLKRAEVTTPASIQLALLLFVVAFAIPCFALMSVRDSHDGFRMFGTFLLSLGAGGLTGFIAIICTAIGARHSPRSVWTIIAIFLAFCVGVGLLYLLTAAMR